MDLNGIHSILSCGSLDHCNDKSKCKSTCYSLGMHHISTESGQQIISPLPFVFQTSDMGLTESVAASPYRFELWFRKRTMGEAFVLQAPSTDVKAAWVKEISKLLWRQAIKNRGEEINNP